ncbi:MAG: UDP-3-O-(3-hydroxymyristoyl)glucosamine N-acyltransferase [Planctomycetes bacterium]|nr:UDP-3-O-(3-hydroxymyristoyl)glucosamine N-acyltransferase [Planctomycetota bacterium]
MAQHTLSELAQVAGALLQGDPSRQVDGTAALGDAGPSHVTFCVDAKHVDGLLATRAAAAVVPRGLEIARPELVRPDLALLLSDDPNRAFTKLCALFATERPRPAVGVHPRAVVATDAVLGEGAAIGELAVVGSRARLGAGVVLHPGVVIGPDCEVGEGTEIHPNTVLYAGVRLGARCLVHAGAVLGADGFGFEPPRRLGEPWTKIPQSGTVVVEDEVEIGANTTIDRARFGITRIGRGTKLDNLIHIAHNCEIGAGSMFAAQVGVAGSTRIGRSAMIGGQAGIGGHLVLGDGLRIGGQAGVIGAVPGGVDLFGTPARPKREALKHFAAVERLPKLLERIAELEARLAALERDRTPTQKEHGA